MTNVDELLQQLFELGQHPKECSDTVTVLEKIGHFLDTENEELFDRFKKEGSNNVEISAQIAKHLRVAHILRRSAKTWDGGYTISGVFGHGDAFIMRDPAGIRPAYYYQDDEILVAASERPAIQTAFDVPFESIKEVRPGYALIAKKDGTITEEMFMEPVEKKACSFERIYFSRGSDAEIYKERKRLGQLLVKPVLNAVNHNIKNTVFAYIPNTAEVAFYGMQEGVNKYVRDLQKETLLHRLDKIGDEELDKMLSISPRFEKLAIKDAKLRTFITQDADRQDMVAHVYDTTYGVVSPHLDTLIVMDDSIVRGTTLKESILTILDRLHPKKIIIVSSAPQIRYPDCYGIDMSKMAEFIAFEAAISLLKKRGMDSLIDEVYQRCIKSLSFSK
jgi:amidophosphoribosyltransferase